MSIKIDCEEYDCNKLRELFKISKENNFIKPNSINNFSCCFNNIHFFYVNNVVTIIINIDNIKEPFTIYENKWLIYHLKVINQIDNFLKKLKKNVDEYINNKQEIILSKLDDFKININCY